MSGLSAGYLQADRHGHTPKGCPDVRLILDFQENQTQPFNFESRSIRSLVSLSSLNDCRCVETQAPNLNPS